MSGMEEIRLIRQAWYVDSGCQIGAAGGFGAVYEGRSEDGVRVAIKKLHLDSTESAHRELRIASTLQEQNFRHVIPVLDSGEDSESNRYFVVMARAERSLKEEIGLRGKMDPSEVLMILCQIAEGIAELSSLSNLGGDSAAIVHRDLKPANILFHNESWKIADFGIAKFVEESTSMQTLKECLSPQYAAPEQWKFERASVATDLYALGCIGYHLLTGKPPFSGPQTEDYRTQHCEVTPEPLPAGIGPRFRTLIEMLLRKNPKARPTLGRLREVLGTLDANVPEMVEGPIASVAARIEAQRAKEDAIRQEKLAKQMEREELAEYGRVSLSRILDRLTAKVEADAPFITRIGSIGIELGRAILKYPHGYNSPLGTIPTTGHYACQIENWDLLLLTELKVEQLEPKYTWSSTLMFSAEKSNSSYRWYEFSCFMPDLSDAYGEERMAPYSLVKSDRSYLLYISPHIESVLEQRSLRHQFAFGPEAIDDEDEDDFIGRWTTILALAAECKLTYPERLPLGHRFWESL